VEGVGLEIADPVAEVGLVVDQALRGAAGSARGEESGAEGAGGAISRRDRVQVAESVGALCGGGR
jgi:hypothetical protein